MGNRKNKRIQARYDTISIIFNGKQEKYNKYRHKKDVMSYDGGMQFEKNLIIQEMLKLYIWNKCQYLPKCHGMTIREQIRCIVPPPLRITSSGAWPELPQGKHLLHIKPGVRYVLQSCKILEWTLSVLLSLSVLGRTS